MLIIIVKSVVGGFNLCSEKSFYAHLNLGKPLSDVDALGHDKPEQIVNSIVKSPSEIAFVRNRMLYARAAFNARGLVQFGLRHIRKSLGILAFMKANNSRCVESVDLCPP